MKRLCKRIVREYYNDKLVIEHDFTYRYSEPSKEVIIRTENWEEFASHHAWRGAKAHWCTVYDYERTIRVRKSKFVKWTYTEEFIPVSPEEFVSIDTLSRKLPEKEFWEYINDRKSVWPLTNIK